MEKFNRVLRGYDPVEVNNFLDSIIVQVENMVAEMKKKDEQIETLKNVATNYNALANQYNLLRNKLQQQANLEDTLKRAIMMAQKTSEQIKLTAYQERDIILNDARKNADRIINEALLRSETIEKEANNLKRNVIIFKRRIKDALQTQLELVDDIETIEL
ncbi:MAG: DivIVA domain-containing protein [Firmicutes bacterium]|nr:DivIVA domain-containing protein [Bacillota bacterium]